jgi:hypothetical protein
MRGAPLTSFQVMVITLTAALPSIRRSAQAEVGHDRHDHH